jgi:hypothetical protein
MEPAIAKLKLAVPLTLQELARQRIAGFRRK